MPASSAMSTSLRAPSTSVFPQALKKSLPPPKVPVPRLSTGTLNPDSPSIRYSMYVALVPIHPIPARLHARFRSSLARLELVAQRDAQQELTRRIREAVRA